MSIRAAIRKAFVEETVQPVSHLPGLLGHAEMSRSRLQIFASAILSEINDPSQPEQEAIFEPGPNKNPKTAQEKAQNEYDGKVDRLTDLCRGRLLVNNVEHISALKKLLDPNNPSQFLESMGTKGYLIRGIKDTFENPTDSGYRAMKIQVEVPKTGGGSHICELQVQHRDMLGVYAESHVIYEAERALSRRFNDTSLSDNEAALKDKCNRMRRELHDSAAQKLGLMSLERH